MERIRLINSLVTVEPVTFLYYISFSLGIVAWQQTLYIKLCHQQGYNASQCANNTWGNAHPQLQEQTSYWTIYTNVATLPPLLFCLTALSGYSDRNGLRLPLILPLVGGTAITVWTILQVIYIDWDPSLLLISPVAWGATGYFPAINMAATTYLIRDRDVVNLGFRIAVLEGLQNFASAVGTLIAGPILDAPSGNGLLIAWITTVVFQLVALADVCFRLKASRSPAQYTQIGQSESCNTLRKCFNLHSLKSYFTAVFRKRDKWKRLHLHIVVVATMLAYMSLAGVTTTVFLYLTKEYSISNTDYSLYQGLNCLLTLIGSTLLVHAFTTRYNLSDIGFTVLGAVSSGVSYTLLGYASYPICYWLAVLFRVFLTYSWIGGRLYISHTMDQGEQAAGMGYYATVQCITTLLASLTFNGLYPATLGLWPGLCFAFAGFLCLLTVPALTFVKWNDMRQGGDGERVV